MSPIPARHPRRLRVYLVALLIAAIFPIAVTVVLALIAARTGESATACAFFAAARGSLAAVTPDGVSEKIQGFDRSRWVITRDDKFTGSGALFLCFVANDQAKARAGVQACRKGIVDQLPERTLALELDTQYVQVAIPNVADGNNALGGAAGVHSPETCGAGDGEFAGRRSTG